MSTSTRPGNTQSGNTSLRYDDVNVGDELPPLPIPLTRTLIVATAIASRDYQDVHHDPGLANDRGSPDIFMNILTSNGFVGRYVTDWAGPDALLKSVTGKTDGIVEVSVRGANSLGDHVSGTVTLVLPS